MPRWCDDHIEQKPPQWIRSVAFRDGRQLCDECLEKRTAHLRPPPLPIAPPPQVPPKVAEEPEPPLAPRPAKKAAPLPRVKELEEPVTTKLCKCGCERQLKPNSPWEYIRGHKPKIGRATVVPERKPTPVEKDGQQWISEVLASLRAQRDKLARAIEALESL